MTHPFWVSKLKLELAINQNLKARICPSSPTAKAAEKDTRITRKTILAHFWGQLLGGSKTVLQKDLKLSEWMSYPKLTNGVVFVFGCVFV